jgi:hypothetical protein
MDTRKVHYADLLYCRPCCGLASDGIVTRDLGEVSCKRCRAIVNECERATIERSQVRAVRHG